MSDNLGQTCRHLDSAVQGLGLKLSTEQWLDMGHPDFRKTPPELRAAAYQIAVLKGYQDEGILRAIKELMGTRFDWDTGQFILADLKELAAIHPAKFEVTEGG